MTRVALYTRVSTEDQAKEGFSLDAQMERLHHYAMAQGWTIAGEYVDDGHSGRTLKRPAYAHMFQDERNWDVILVLKMDRIHRSSRNFLAMMDHLQVDGKHFASVMESIDTATAMGRFVMGVISGIAQLESEQIGERVLVGMEQKAKAGKGSLGRQAPYGYAYGPDGRFIPVPDEAVHVRWMFEAHGKGLRKGEIAGVLNRNGVQTRLKNRWTVWNISAILNNPTYRGELHWRNTVQKNSHPALVEA